MSASVTGEAEGRYPGYRENHAGPAYLLLVVAVAAAVGALVAARRGPRVRFVAVGLVCCALVVASAWRGRALEPMLDCLGHPRVAQQQDGSYRCAP